MMRGLAIGTSTLYDIPYELYDISYELYDIPYGPRPAIPYPRREEAVRFTDLSLFLN